MLMYGCREGCGDRSEVVYRKLCCVRVWVWVLMYGCREGCGDRAKVVYRRLCCVRVWVWVSDVWV